jgi:NAD(P)-dependent dehydrogenase (short-subunit alcohol dehydrogenase family)
MEEKNYWALILGSSSGFGESISIELAKNGYNIFGVHLDRRNTIPNVERIIQTIKSTGREAHFFNVNAADDEKRKEVIDKIKNITQGKEGAVRVFVHSIAFGTLKPFISLNNPSEGIMKSQMEMTLDVMANSLVYWVQDLVKEKLMSKGGRIFAMTSAGSHRVWKGYGAVSAAKSALESHIRQLAVELAPLGITANSIRAGVTETPALQKIPGHEEMLKLAREHNPSGRLTEPVDVAKAILALSSQETYWITGNVINVDGGEDIAG